jgi:hypothetical protein
MSTLVVGNGYQASLPGLGKIRGLLNLSRKRVTIAVRQELRRQYGLPYVIVSCEAALASKGWNGSCTIHGKKFEYMCS